VRETRPLFSRYGYAAPALHFFGLLRAPGFKRLVEEGKRFRSREPLGGLGGATGGRKRKAASEAGKKSAAAGRAPTTLHLVPQPLAGVAAADREAEEEEEEEECDYEEGEGMAAQ
jgi:hypothetical protein